MNLLLLNERAESLSLLEGDPRAVHLLEVLKVKPGDEIDLALKNGPRGKGKVSIPGDGQVELSIRWMEPHLRDLFPVHLVVGLARPQTCRKILEQVAAMGIEEITFFHGEKSDPAYAKSRLWTSNEWSERIDRGVEQSFSSFGPSCKVVDRLEEALLFSNEDKPVKLALDNYEATGPLVTPKAEINESFLLALGPERGWSSSERELLRSLDFTILHLGDRVVRLETAVVASLGVVLSAYWPKGGSSIL